MLGKSCSFLFFLRGKKKQLYDVLCKMLLVSFNTLEYEINAIDKISYFVFIYTFMYI